MRVLLFVVAVSMCTTASAAAQTCKGNDALSSARRARRALEDVAATNTEVDRDLSRLREAQSLWPHGGAERRVYATAVGEIDYFTSFPTCTTAGVQDGALARNRAGFVAGYDRGHIGIRLHWIASSDALHVTDPVGHALDEAIAVERKRNPTAPAVRGSSPGTLAFGQRVFGGSLTLSRWARVEIDHVTTLAPAYGASYPSGIEVSEAPDAATAEGRVLGALTIPAIHLSSEALTNTDSGAVDLVRVGSTRLRIADTGLLATINTSYIADERQVTTLAGLTYQGWFRRHGQRRPVTIRRAEAVYREGVGYELGGEASGEYRSGRLRHTRLRAEAFAVGSRAAPPSVWYGPTYLRAGTFAEITSFGSAYFTEKTGRANVLGGGGGVHAGFGTRFVSMHAEAYGGANRPEAVARVSEVATRGEFKGQLYLRAGW